MYPRRFRFGKGGTFEHGCVKSFPFGKEADTSSSFRFQSEFFVSLNIAWLLNSGFDMNNLDSRHERVHLIYLRIFFSLHFGVLCSSDLMFSSLSCVVQRHSFSSSFLLVFFSMRFPSSSPYPSPPHSPPPEFHHKPFFPSHFCQSLLLIEFHSIPACDFSTFVLFSRTHLK